MRLPAGREETGLWVVSLAGWGWKEGSWLFCLGLDPASSPPLASWGGGDQLVVL